MPQSHKVHPHTFSWKIDINSHLRRRNLERDQFVSVAVLQRYLFANFQNWMLSKIQLIKSIRTRLIEMIVWQGDGEQSKLTLVSIQWVKNLQQIWLAMASRSLVEGFVTVIVWGDSPPWWRLTANIIWENTSNVTLVPIESPSPKVNYHLVPDCFLWHQILCEFRGGWEAKLYSFLSICLFKSVLLSGKVKCKL